MSTTIERTQAKTDPTTEQVAHCLYVEGDGPRLVFCQTIAHDFAMPGFEQRAQKFIAGADAAERTMFKAESADIRSMVRILLVKAGQNPLFRPNVGKPIPNENFAANGEDWAQFLVSIGAVPRPGAIRRYHVKIARLRRAAEAAALPKPMSELIEGLLVASRAERQTDRKQRLGRLLATMVTSRDTSLVPAVLEAADALLLSEQIVARHVAMIESAIVLEDMYTSLGENAAQQIRADLKRQINVRSGEIPYVYDRSVDPPMLWRTL